MTDERITTRFDGREVQTHNIPAPDMSSCSAVQPLVIAATSSVELKPSSLRIKAEVANYWRYQQQHHLIAEEAFGADIVSARFKLYRGEHLKCRMVETEVKVTLDDLRADRDKGYGGNKHPTMGMAMRNEPYQTHYRHFMPNQFYFAVPESIVERSKLNVKNLYPHAGLMVVKDNQCRSLPGTCVEVVIRAPLLKKDDQTLHTLLNFVKHQSGTTARLLDRMARR